MGANIAWLIYREEEEDDLEYLRRLGGVLDRDLDILRRGGGERRRGGGGERRRILGGDLHRCGGGPLLCGGGLKGDRRRGGALWLCINTGAAEISWPSICPPSICFIAFSASSGFSNSTYP